MYSVGSAKGSFSILIYCKEENTKKLRKRLDIVWIRIIIRNGTLLAVKKKNKKLFFFFFFFFFRTLINIILIIYH